jgi:hypothetical protein
MKQQLLHLKNTTAASTKLHTNYTSYLERKIAQLLFNW